MSVALCQAQRRSPRSIAATYGDGAGAPFSPRNFGHPPPASGRGAGSSSNTPAGGQSNFLDATCWERGGRPQPEIKVQRTALAALGCPVGPLGAATCRTGAACTGSILEIGNGGRPERNWPPGGFAPLFQWQGPAQHEANREKRKRSQKPPKKNLPEIGPGLRQPRESPPRSAPGAPSNSKTNTI